MKRFSVCFYVLLFLCIQLNLSCSKFLGATETNSKKCSVKILDWNLETFFDGIFDGDEYKEFSQASYGWTMEKYDARLSRLAEVIKSVDADIVVMQELEKKEQLYDIFNRVCSNFDFSKNYKYACFCRENGSSIGCAVISRFPFTGVKVHSMDIRTQKKSQPAMRPLMELTVHVKDRNFLLLVNHWKSKSGGAEQSEVWRDYQERILAQRFCRALEKKQSVLACGDFNRNITEFKYVNSYDGKTNIELRGAKNVLVYSPWFDECGNLFGSGSYWFKFNWERIDHFFAGADTELFDFKVENKGSWATSDGRPIRYYMKQGAGYSDHFPLSCSLRF